MEGRDNPAGASTISDETLACIFAHLDKPADRRAISQVCWQWKRVDSSSRKYVQIANCYSVTPDMLSKRFPNLTSLKVKGMPLAGEYGLLPENWGAYALPWIEEVANSYGNKMQSLWLRRMHVEDDDLKLLAQSCSESLLSLKLHKCYGFSTAGLAAISASCRSLKELFLEWSDVAEPPIAETSAASLWLKNLALNAHNLEELNFQYTTGTGLLDIVVSDLELLMENCKALSSVKLNSIDILGVAGLFANSTVLSELGTGSWQNVGDPQASPLSVVFPRSIIGLSGLYEFTDTSVPMITSVLGNLKMLNLQTAYLTPEGHQEVLGRCGNLEVLLANSGIGDDGLITLAESCKNLRRLRIMEHVDGGLISPAGIIPLAQNCVRLEFLCLYATSLDNASLAAIGEHCKVLKDVRIVLSHDKDASEDNDFPLDEGVKALLEGSPEVTRFALYLWHGTLTDAGMANIGKYGAKLKWLLLGAVGESDEGLLSVARGCHSLERLEIRDCPGITEGGLASAASEMHESLKFMWVQGKHSTQDGGNLLSSCRSHWIVEVTTSAQPGHEQFTAYCSLVGPRTDHPPEITVKSSRDENGLLLVDENGGP